MKRENQFQKGHQTRKKTENEGGYAKGLVTRSVRTMLECEALARVDVDLGGQLTNQPFKPGTWGVPHRDAGVFLPQHAWPGVADSPGDASRGAGWQAIFSTRLANNPL